MEQQRLHLGKRVAIAWRVHDAQFWGVPQRRKRISLVADFGGETAPEILFERDSVRGDIEASGEQGQGTARTAETGSDKAISFQERAGCEGGGKGILIQHEKTGASSTLANQYVCNSSGQEISGTLDSYYGNGCGSRGGVEREVIAYGISAYESNAMKSDNPRSGCYKADTARTLDNNGGNPACNQGGIAVVYDAYQHHGYRENETCGTMTEKQNFFIRGDTPIVIEPILLESNQKHATVQTDGVSTALPASAGMGGGYVPMVAYPINTMVGTRTTAEKRTTMGIGDADDPQFTISSAHAHAVCIENHPADSRVSIAENGIVQTLSGRMGTGGGNVPMVMENVEEGNAYAIGNGQADQTGLHDKAGALNCMHDQQAVITYGLDRAAYNQGKNAKYNFSVEEEKIGAQVAKGPGAVYNTVVRRLTPLECERLQGYPDGWTDIGEWIDSKGKKHKDADSPRYKALGNSIALPFWQWLANRICKQYDRQPTMASLFDGIGGFPLVFSRVGAEPVWSSEIEEFPMAVTRKHFG